MYDIYGYQWRASFEKRSRDFKCVVTCVFARTAVITLNLKHEVCYVVYCVITQFSFIQEIKHISM
jgi:hypothetical protein